MSITIGSYNFEGPFTSEAHLRPMSGVYVILGRNSETANWNVVDVGESGNVQNRINSHDRAPDWKRCGYGVLAAAAYYVPELQRMTIERQLRLQYNPHCGER